MNSNIFLANKRTYYELTHILHRCFIYDQELLVLRYLPFHHQVYTIMLYWGRSSLHPTDVAGELSPHVVGSADLDCPLYSASHADLTDVFHRAYPAGGVEEKGGEGQLWAAL